MAEHLSLTEVKLSKIKTVVKKLSVETLENFAVYTMQILFPISQVSTETPVYQKRQINN